MKAPAWSHTSLETFNQCPKKWFHKYILKEKEPSSPALERGNYVHKSIENYLLNKAAMPDDLAGFAPLVNSVESKVNLGGKIHIEYKMGLTEQLYAAEFFSKNVWARASADVVIVDGRKALVIDWKTGKVREKEKQLKILAMFLFRHIPSLQEITACNIWLEHGKGGEVYKFYNEKESEYWSGLKPEIQAVEKAVENNQFECKPSPLCGWCFVKDCKFNK